MRISTFNLYNFAAPPMAWYQRSNRYSATEWEAKRAWVAGRIADLQLDIVGFQEVFSVGALQSLAAAAGLTHFHVAETPRVSADDPQVFDRPVVAIASRFPILGSRVPVIEDEMRSFLHLPDDFAFSRLPLAVELDVPGFPGLMVYVIHLKSKRPIMEDVAYPADMPWEEQVADTMRRTSRGQIAALLQRGAEAAAVYADLTAVVRNNRNRPIVILGDLNDDDRSVTLESLQMLRQLSYIGAQSMQSATSAQRSALFSFRFQDVWDLAPNQTGGDRPETFRFMGRPSVIDYILVSNGLNEMNRQGWVGRASAFAVDNAHIQGLVGRWDRADPARSDHGIPHVTFVPRLPSP